MKNRTFPLKGIFSQLYLFMSMPALLWEVLFLGIPLVSIVGMSLIQPTQGSLFLTLSHYWSLFTPIYFRIIARSTLLAFVNAFLCLICAYPVVYFLVFRIKRMKHFFLFLLVLPFWTSLLVQAYAWFFVLEKYGLINSLLLKIGLISSPLHLLNTSFAIYLVMTYCYLPFMILPLYTALEKIDRKLIEASLDLGAGPLQTFLRVTWPLSLSGIKTGFFLVFVPSFGEFVIPSLLGGAKSFYIGSLIEQYFLVSRDIYTGAAFTCLAGLILVALVLVIQSYFARLTSVSKRNLS